jgi:hypothetical protein
MWFVKKKDKTGTTGGNFSQLPDLPDFPELPGESLGDEKTSILSEELPSLPSFPPSDMAEEISQQAIKSEINTPSLTKPYTQEISPVQKEVEKKRVLEISPRQEKLEPVFVRLDKFQGSLKNFQEIKKQMGDIEAYLSDIRRIREKEDAELGEWEKELIDIKIKLESIDSTLFNKLER